MKELKALLQLQRPEHDNPMRLHRQQYEVTAFDYLFDKDYDRTGRVVSDTMGGTLHVTLSSLPTDELMAWVFDHRKFINGEITLFDNAIGSNESHITFEQARCVNFKMLYDMNACAAPCVQLTINTPKLILGNTEYLNPWK